MDPIGNILDSAREILKTIDPGAAVPETWREKARSLRDASPAERAGFAREILQTLNDARWKALERLARADAGLHDLFRAAASLLVEADAPPPPHPMPPARDGSRSFPPGKKPPGLRPRDPNPWRNPRRRTPLPWRPCGPWRA